MTPIFTVPRLYQLLVRNDSQLLISWTLLPQGNFNYKEITCMHYYNTLHLSTINMSHVQRQCSAIAKLKFICSTFLESYSGTQ